MKKRKHHTLMIPLLVSFMVAGQFALVFGCDSPLAYMSMTKKVLAIIAIIAIELLFYVFFYRIEYGGATKEEKAKRIERLTSMDGN